MIESVREIIRYNPTVDWKRQGDLPAHFLSLSNKHKNRVCGVILNASFLREGGKDWRQPFIEKIPRSAGRTKEIYITASLLEDDAFDHMVSVMTADDS